MKLHVSLAVAVLASLGAAVLFGTPCGAQSMPKLLNLIEGRGDLDADWSGDGVADRWSATFSSAVFTPSVVAESPYRGNRCQKVVINKNDSNTYSLNLWTTINTDNSVLRSGTRLKVSFWYKTSSSMQNVQWKIYYNGVNVDLSGDYYEIRRLTNLAPQSSWKQWTGECTVKDTSISANIGIYLYSTAGQSTGTFYVDDVQVTDGRLVLPKLKKDLKLYLCYLPYVNWIETVRLFDGCSFHGGDDFAAVQHTDPTFRTAIFTRVTYVWQGYSESPENPFTYDWILANHPDWFLTDSQGNKIHAGVEYALDFGNTSYQQALLAKLQSMAGRENYQALFLDAFGPFADSNHVGTGRPSQYPTDAQWVAAVTAFFQALQPLRQQGIKLYPNLAHVSNYEEPGVTWFSLVDGAVFEWGYAMKAVDTGLLTYGTWDSWKYKFLSSATNTTKLLVVNHQLPLDWKDQRRFALASYLCSMTDWDYLGMVPNESSTYWVTDFEAPYGTPTGPYQIIAGDMNTGAVVKRTFTNSTVIANPTDSITYNYNVIGSYKDLDGNIVANKTVSIPPKGSLILINAPNIQIALAATPATAAPGEIVTYTVTYTNIGTANAKNTYVSAPIPAWSTYYAVLNGGVYDSINKKVVWTISNLAAGASGTVSFKVKIMQ